MVRWSVALSRQLIEEASAVAPPGLRQNLNRLVTVALQEFAAQRKECAFEEAMARMAADPAIRKECAVISKAFAIADGDGLKGDQSRPNLLREPESNAGEGTGWSVACLGGYVGRDQPTAPRDYCGRGH